MNPQEEAADLLLHPLPPEIKGEIISPEDKILPTRIAAIDMDIADLKLSIKTIQEQISDLEDTRKILIDHAIKHNVFEDIRFKIQTEIKYGTRILNLETIKKANPSGYKNYISVLKQKFKDEYTVKIASVKTTILLGIADDVFGEQVVKAHSIRPETITYKVVKKDG